MDLSALVDLGVVLLAACMATAGCLLIARFARLGRLVDRCNRLLSPQPDDTLSKLTRLAFPVAALVLVVTVVALGLIAQPIWAATTLVLLCAGMTAFAISGGRSPARLELRAQQRGHAHASLKKAA